MFSTVIELHVLCYMEHTRNLDKVVCAPDLDGFEDRYWRLEPGMKKVIAEA